MIGLFRDLKELTITISKMLQVQMLLILRYVVLIQHMTLIWKYSQQIMIVMKLQQVIILMMQRVNLVVCNRHYGEFPYQLDNIILLLMAIVAKKANMKSM